MKVTVSVPGKFSMGYLWAAYLERQEMLERLITPVPYRRGSHFGVSRERTRSVWPIGAANWGMQHLAPGAVQPLNQIAVSASYDAAAARMLGDCDVFNGWASMALKSIRAARARGIPSVLQIASAHIETQAELLAEESRRFGVREAATHPAVIARTLREYEEADVLAVPSAFVLRTFEERGVPARKLALVPWGVHPVEGADRGAPDATAVRDDEAEPQKLRILFVGSVGLRKGVAYLLAAFERLETPATLRLVGPVDRGFVKALGGLPEGVEAVGTKTGEALAAEFRAADVFVLPSVEDGYGVVTTEAMAAGLPVIVSANCGSADAVREGENGYVVPARDVELLRERLGLLLADDALRARVGAAAAASTGGWSWEESGAAHVAKIYEPLWRSATQEQERERDVAHVA